MKTNTSRRYAYCILNSEKRVVAGRNYNDTFDPFSTVKVAIVYATLIAVREKGSSLHDRMVRKWKHRSHGSGIINWTTWRTFTISEVIAYTLSMSDCVASNMLLEYIGGQEGFNNWSGTAKNSDVRLVVESLFNRRRQLGQHIATASTLQLCEFYVDLMNEDWPAETKELLTTSMGQPKLSWFEQITNGAHLLDHHKTGSSVNTEKKNQRKSTYNIIGDFYIGSRKLYLCIFSEHESSVPLKKIEAWERMAREATLQKINELIAHENHRAFAVSESA